MIVHKICLYVQVVYASDLENSNLSLLRCRLSTFGKCRWAICYGAPGGDG